MTIFIISLSIINLSYATNYNLTLLTSPPSCGSITGAKNGSYSSGTQLNLTAVPSSGCNFTQWQAIGIGTGISPTKTINVTIQSNTTEVANFQRTGSSNSSLTLVITPKGGGTVSPCTGPCNNGYPPNSKVTISATPSPGYAFQLWICSGTGWGCNFGFNSTQSITLYSNSSIIEQALFYKTQTQQLDDQLIESSNPSGAGILSPCNGTCNYTNGSKITISEIPHTGYTFTGWSCYVLGGAACYSGSNSTATITVNASQISETADYQSTSNVSITYAVTPSVCATYVINGKASYNIISGSAGTQINISAPTVPNCVFTNWVGTGTGSYTGSNTTIKTFLSNNITETAHYNPLSTTNLLLTTFTLNGSLPRGTPFGVFLSGNGYYEFNATYTPNQTLTFRLPPGNYQFAASNSTLIFYIAFKHLANGTIQAGSSKAVSFNANNTSLTLKTTKFTETGLPPGVAFAVYYDGLLKSTSASNISFTTLPGTYPFIVSRRSSGPFFDSNVTLYTPSISNGTLQAGSTQAITFTATSDPQTTVKETGLPSGGLFTLKLGINESLYLTLTINTSAIFSFAPGMTYNYTVYNYTQGNSTYVPLNNSGVLNTGSTLVVVFRKFNSVNTTTTLTELSTPKNAGTLSPCNGNCTYVTGTKVILSAIPAAGYKFVQWLCFGNSNTCYSGSNSTATITLNNPVTETAWFEHMPENLTVNVSPQNGGLVTGNGSYNYGTQVAIFETPDVGYAFVNWTCQGTGCYAGTNKKPVVTMDSQITETANFQIIKSNTTTVTKAQTNITNSNNSTTSNQTTNQSSIQKQSITSSIGNAVKGFWDGITNFFSSLFKGL